MVPITIVFEEDHRDLFFPLVRRREITQRAFDVVIDYDLDFTERGGLSVEEDLQLRSRGPKMTSKRMFESVPARVGEVSLQIG